MFFFRFENCHIFEPILLFPADFLLTREIKIFSFLKIGAPSTRLCCFNALTLQPLFFFGKGKPTKKARVFLFVKPLKSLEAKGKRTKEARKIGKGEKTRKSQKARIGESGLRLPNIAIWNLHFRNASICDFIPQCFCGAPSLGTVCNRAGTI